VDQKQVEKLTAELSVAPLIVMMA